MDLSQMAVHSSAPRLLGSGEAHHMLEADEAVCGVLGAQILVAGPGPEGPSS